MQEEQKKHRMRHEENNFYMLPEDTEKTQSGYRPTYCTVCNKQIEKYGRRQEDFKKPGWVFCPKHGWIQEGVQVKEMDSEKPLWLSIEEVREDHNEYGKSPVQEESNIETPQEFSIQEEKRQEIEFIYKGEPRIANLFKEPAKNKVTFTGIVVSVIFFIVIVSSLVGYFVWKGSSKEMLQIKSIQALADNKKLTSARNQFNVSDLSKESVLPENYTDAITDRIASPHDEAVLEGGQTEPREKAIKKTNQSREPLVVIYTVQVGAFTDISHARSLKNRLDRKEFHSYISHPKSNNEGGLYKVWLGKFTNRKKAESISEKITKAESIETFVTVWGNNI